MRKIRVRAVNGPRMAQALRDAGFQAEWSPELGLEPEFRDRILLIRGSSQLDPMKAFLAGVMLGPRRPQTASPVTPRLWAKPATPWWWSSTRMGVKPSPSRHGPAAVPPAGGGT